MSIEEAFRKSGIDISQYMNKPEPCDGKGMIKTFPNGEQWIVCPFCYKKALKIDKYTRIEHLTIKCKGSNCKKEYEINVG